MLEKGGKRKIMMEKPLIMTSPLRANYSRREAPMPRDASGEEGGLERPFQGDPQSQRAHIQIVRVE